MPDIDLECDRRSSAGAGAEKEEEEGSVCFSDADEGSCNSQFFSTADGDGSYQDFSVSFSSEILEDEVFESRRASDCSVDIEIGGRMARNDRDCRICHLSLVSSSPCSGVAIELGCCCKDDLAAAHKHCAETWFKIKGNKTCEICNSIARNVVGPNDIEAGPNDFETSVTASTATAAAAPATTEARSCLNGHRFLNLLLACMVFAFVVSWLFHFNIPS